MELDMDSKYLQALNDTFDAFTMLAGGSFVTMMHIDGNVTRFSPGAVELFGLPGEYFPNGAFDWNDFLHPEDRKRNMALMNTLLTGDQHTYDITYRVRTQSGEYVYFRAIGAVLRNDEGSPSLIGGLLINQGLMENTDPITVLRNKYGYFEDIARLIQAGQQSITLLVGFNKLSHINQIYGYTYGNRTLQEVAWLIQETVGERGRIYRMDDATFAVLTESLSREQTAAIYDSIRLKLQRGIRVDGVRNILIANGGLISTQGLRTDAGTVYSCLRYAYQESKHRMHGELVDFNGSSNYDLRESIEMINVIRDCIMEDCKGFFIDYQPLVSAQTEKLTGVEALVRWEGDPYGKVEPLEFIPILEKDFVFEELGNWILNRALTDGVGLLKQNASLSLCLNISSSQLEDEYFIDSVFQALHKTGFPPQNLCLDLTKDCRLLDLNRLTEVVDALHRHHIRVIIDDFGTGFESIGFLKRLSADSIKLDRQLVEEIETNEADRHTVEYLIKLAALRGTRVIVKGVETEGMCNILREFSITHLQGNYYAKPTPFQQLMQKYF